MATIPQYEDPWRVRPRGGGGEELLAQKMELIQDIIPLDAQVGVLSKKTVPDALHQAMFGQEPTAAQLEHTYAILDAAKVPNLLEMLEDSGLEYRCLFIGEAQDDMGQVAPWIVRLEEGSSFTRNLFTRGDAPWCLWDAEAGIYVRSIAALDEVWRHFRKFTRVQDNAGKWYLFRYWEPDSVVFANHITQLTDVSAGTSRLLGRLTENHRLISVFDGTAYILSSRQGVKPGNDKISVRFFEYAYAAKIIRNQGGALPRGRAEFEILHLLLINKMLDANIFRWAKQVSNVQGGSWIMKKVVEHRMISSLVKRDALRYLASRLS